MDETQIEVWKSIKKARRDEINRHLNEALRLLVVMNDYGSISTFAYSIKLMNQRWEKEGDEDRS